MIEIPESRTIAGQLNETVYGKKIVEVDAAHSPHSFAWYVGDPAEYASMMEGRVVGKAVGIGSMVELKLDDLSFTVGDGTNIRYYGAEEKIPDKYQTRITFEDDSSLICTVQMYGSMLLFDPKVYDNPYYWVGKQKPMPGTSGFTMDYFRGLLTNGTSKLSTKAFLATQQRIPGLGNGVLQDILLTAGLHPKRKMDTLSEVELDCLYDTVVSVLTDMTKLGGRDTEKDLFGHVGGYQTKLSKNTKGYCPICGGPVQKMAYMGGSVYICENCQPLIK